MGVGPRVPVFPHLLWLCNGGTRASRDCGPHPCLRVLYYDSGNNTTGNITNDQTFGYLYDAWGKICAAHGVGGWTGYVYDAEGNRVAKVPLSTAPTSCDPTTNGILANIGMATLYVLAPDGEKMTSCGPWPDDAPRRCSMKPPLRTKSVSTKVSEEEFVALESRARARKLTLSEWVRAEPGRRFFSREVLALRTILMNLLFSLSNGKPATPV